MSTTAPSDPNPGFAVVIPCYRSTQWIGQLVDEIVATYGPNGLQQVILIDDCSPDATWPAIKAAAAKHSCVEGLTLQSNAGQYCATLCGIGQTNSDVVVTMDDDYQHGPADIQTLIDALVTTNSDCVFADLEGKQHGLHRRVGSKLRELLFNWYYGKRTNVRATGFRAMLGDFARSLELHSGRRPSLNAMILQSTRRIAAAHVKHHPRRAGTSGYTLRGLSKLLLDSVLTATTLPLRACSLLGLTSALGAFLLASYYTVQALFVGFRQPGFATLVILITFFGGMTLFSLGIVGEYLIRILNELVGPPKYLVRARTTAKTARRPTDASTKPQTGVE